MIVIWGHIESSWGEVVKKSRVYGFAPDDRPYSVGSFYPSPSSVSSSLSFAFTTSSLFRLCRYRFDPSSPWLATRSLLPTPTRRSFLMLCHKRLLVFSFMLCHKRLRVSFFKLCHKPLPVFPLIFLLQAG